MTKDAKKPDPRAAQAATDEKTKTANEAAKKAAAAKAEISKAKRAAQDAKKIKIKVEKNPKRESSASHARFAIYKNGMTVGQYLAACEAAKHNTRAARSDISWDQEHGYIELTD
jgi:hypothetical protein